MNISYRFKNERNPAKEKEFIRALIELARKHPEEELDKIAAEKAKSGISGKS
jgi:hypothetical protein